MLCLNIYIECFWFESNGWIIDSKWKFSTRSSSGHIVASMWKKICIHTYKVTGFCKKISIHFKALRLVPSTGQFNNNNNWIVYRNRVDRRRISKYSSFMHKIIARDILFSFFAHSRSINLFSLCLCVWVFFSFCFMFLCLEAERTSKRAWTLDGNLVCMTYKVNMYMAEILYVAIVLKCVVVLLWCVKIYLSNSQRFC